MKRSPIHLHIVPEEGPSFPFFIVPHVFILPAAKKVAECYLSVAPEKVKAIVVKRANGKCPDVLWGSGNWLGDA